MSSRSVRNNNPGNLRFSTFTEERGAVDDGDNYSKFSDLPRGTACMVTLLAQKGYRNLTMTEAIKRYAPASDSNYPDQYASFVSKKSGISRMKKITSMTPFEFLDMCKAMIEFEGWKA
jgi:hypothetical protein